MHQLKIAILSNIIKDYHLRFVAEAKNIGAEVFLIKYSDLTVAATGKKN